MLSRGTASDASPSCETFSSRVMRDTRSATRSSTGSFEFLYAGSPEVCCANNVEQIAAQRNAPMKIAVFFFMCPAAGQGCIITGPFEAVYPYFARKTIFSEIASRDIDRPS